MLRSNPWRIPLIMQAIRHIAFVLTGTTDSQEAASILSYFFEQEDNRISYQNALVMEEEGEVVGVAIFYDGAVVNLKVEEYYPSGKRFLLRFREKGGKEKES